jgi:hypothetical protein
METRPGAGELALLPRALRLRRFLRSVWRSGGSQWLGSRPGNVALVAQAAQCGLRWQNGVAQPVVVGFGNVSATSPTEVAAAIRGGASQAGWESWARRHCAHRFVTNGWSGVSPYEQVWMAWKHLYQGDDYQDERICRRPWWCESGEPVVNQFVDLYVHHLLVAGFSAYVSGGEGVRKFVMPDRSSFVEPFLPLMAGRDGRGPYLARSAAVTLTGGYRRGHKPLIAWPDRQTEP